MTEKDYHYVFIFLTIYFAEFLHFSEKKFNDIFRKNSFRKNDNETDTDTYYPLLNAFLQIKTMAIQVSDSTMTYLPANAHVMR